MMTTIARMSDAELIMWFLMAGTVIAILFFVLSYFVDSRKSNRLKSVLTSTRTDLSRKQMEEFRKPSAIRQQKGQSKAFAELSQTLLAKLNLQNLLHSTEVRQVLAQAGIRGRNAVAVYMSTRFVTAFGALIVTLVVLGLAKNFPYPEFVKLLFAALAGVIGFYIPRILVMNNAQKRQQEMTEAFPDALDLLVICVESGLGVEAAFTRVTEEIMESSPALAQEFGLTSAELAYLGDRRRAYENLANRTGLPSAKSLSTTLIQSEQYGTPVGQALRVLSQEKRDERMSEAEKKAAALPAKLTVPMIIFFLPVLFMVVIGPAAIQIGNM